MYTPKIMLIPDYIEEIERLKKENEKLKKKYENAVADYETTNFEKEQLNSLVNSCQEEIRQLKKQNNNFKTSLDESQEVILDYIKENQKLKEQVSKGLYNTCLPYSTGYNKAIKDKETQQKEFINYLENMLDDENDIFSVVRIKDALQKYREIIGVSDESNKQ